MAIEIRHGKNDEILELWQDSPHSTIFTHPKILEKLSREVDWWIAWKGQEPQCFWPVCRPQGEFVSLPELTYWVGPMWTRVTWPIPHHRWLSRTTRVYEAFIHRFIKEYGKIQASLPKGLQDVRVYDWWNYHRPEGPHFTIKPRYTAVIPDLDKKSDEDVTAGYRQLRRRELRSLEEEGPPPLTANWETEDLIRLYEDVMGLQDIEVEKENRRKIIALAGLVQDGFGEVVAYREPSNGKVIAACLVLYGRGEANMVLNLVDTDWRDSGLPAWMVTTAIHNARSRGMHVFDFNGANSPNRGDDKHSYGSEPVLFFEIEYPGGA